MHKTIKFNLICDEKPVRTIEDLQNNFSIEDVLAYYNNQLLHRWLRVRGYEEELKAVSAITSTEPMEIIKELIRIFDVASDEEKVEESIYMLQYLEDRKEFCAVYELEKYNAAHIIEDYEAGYRQLVSEIYSNPNNVAIIKANIAEIVSNYSWIFRLNHRDLFWGLRYNHAPDTSYNYDSTFYNPDSVLAIMCLLMNDKSREYYLPLDVDGDGSLDIDVDDNTDKRAMFENICSLIQQSDFANSLGSNLKIFSGDTDGYWKDLEPKGKHYMVISMGVGDYVRPAEQTGGDLSHKDVLNQFRIIDGVDYKSNSTIRKLFYMEV